MTVAGYETPRRDFSLIDLDRVVPRPEAAAWLGVCLSTMNVWHRQGTGPDWVQLGARRGGYTLRALSAFVQSRTAAARTRRAA